LSNSIDPSGRETKKQHFLIFTVFPIT
jgi:hypothetical protein